MEERAILTSGIQQDPEASADVRAPFQPGAEHLPAWEEIEAGRYRPRRIRGSFPGRELG
jgi:hypothetical protein